MELQQTLDIIDANYDDIFVDQVHISTEELDELAGSQSNEILEKIILLYQDDKFLTAHPQLSRRLGIEIENLRSLLKMRAADEKAHDAILKAISTDNTNASMYKVLTEVQKTSISLTSKIQEIIKNLEGMVKGVQLELEFEENEEQSQTTGIRARGTKSFIESLGMNS